MGGERDVFAKCFKRVFAKCFTRTGLAQVLFVVVLLQFVEMGREKGAGRGGRGGGVDGVLRGAVPQGRTAPGSGRAVPVPPPDPKSAIPPPPRGPGGPGVNLFSLNSGGTRCYGGFARVAELVDIVASFNTHTKFFENTV